MTYAAASYPNYKRYIGAFRLGPAMRFWLLTDVANELRDRGALDEEECFIDATFVMAKGGGAEIGATKRGKGMKIMANVDSPWIAAIGKHACGQPSRSPPGAAVQPGLPALHLLQLNPYVAQVIVLSVCDLWLDNLGNLSLSGVRLIRIVHQSGAFDFG